MSCVCQVSIIGVCDANLPVVKLCANCWCDRILGARFIMGRLVSLGGHKLEPGFLRTAQGRGRHGRQLVVGDDV